MNAPSCHLGSSFACLAPPGRIVMKYTRSPNSTSCLRYGLTSMQFSTLCASVTTNLTPRHQSPHVFHEKRQGWDVSKVLRISCALPNAPLFINLTCFCISRTVTSMVAIRLMLFNRTLLHHKLGIDSRTACLRARIAGS